MINFSGDRSSRSDTGGQAWFRAMEPTDTRSVLQLIADHDEEDAEGAAATFARDMLGYFVTGAGNKIVGVTGATPIPDANASYVLGWTAVDSDCSGDILRELIAAMLEQLRDAGGRKIFAQVSDYIDPQEGDINAPLRQSLTELGFAQEVRHRDYYDRNEAQIIYSLRLREPEPIDVVPDRRGIRLTDVDEIGDTNDAYWLSWELSEQADPLSREDFQRVFDTVRQAGARCIFMAFPTGIAAVSSMMQSAGFRFDGRLLDLYDDGVDELRFRYDL